MTCGVYSIRNFVNGKQYVGSSCDIEQRKRSHTSLLKRGIHPNPRLQNSWNKYGEASFVFEVLELCAESSLLVQEQATMDRLKPKLNICPFADRPPRHQLGRPFSDKHRAALAVSHRGKRHTDETKAKMRAAWLRRKAQQIAAAQDILPIKINS